MRKNKIGVVFIVSVLALTGISVSYAGFSDSISVYGSVETGTVILTVYDYSGTLVWKIWDLPDYDPPLYDGLTYYLDDELAIYRGFNCDIAKADIELLFDNWGCQYEFVAYAKALPGTIHDGVQYDVDMVWWNIFPCIDFTADVVIHYDGSIPARVSVGEIIWNQDYFDFSDYTSYRYFSYTEEEGKEMFINSLRVIVPTPQMHFCEYLGIEITIHLPQLNTLQGQHGEFSFNINAVQWYDPCD